MWLALRIILVELLKIISKQSNGNTGKRANADDIYLSLRNYITSTRLTSEKLPTVSDLAVCYSANYRTVKSALSRLEDEGYIDYKPNVGAKVKARQEIVYIQWEDNAFCGLMSDGVRKFIEEKTDIELTVINAHKNHSLACESIESFIDQMDGVLLMPFEGVGYESVLGSIVSAGKRIVFVDRVLDGIDAGSVTTDDFGGAFKAVSYLLDRHSRPVFYVGKTCEPSSSVNRYRGWKEAMREHGYFDFDKYCIDINIRQSELASTNKLARDFEAEASERLFKENPFKSYSVFTGNDNIAGYVYKSAESRGLSIGSDVCVAGFGNLPFCEKLSVSLTSVQQCPVELGYEAAKMLYLQLSGQISRPVHKVLPANLIIRASSG
jgi:DNA-binding LacI/PurR family transcriptional regulator